MSATTELELKNALMQVPGATDSVSNRIVRAVAAEAALGGGSGGGGGSGLDSTTYTATQLQDWVLYGTTPTPTPTVFPTMYAASDDLTRTFLSSSSTVAVETTVQPSYLAITAVSAQTVAFAALTDVGSAIDARGWRTLALKYTNNDATDPLQNFEISHRQTTGDTWTVAETLGDYTDLDDGFLTFVSQTSGTDPNTLPALAILTVRLNVDGLGYIRVRARQAVADGTGSLLGTLSRA